MRSRWLFVLSAMGVLFACYAAYLSTITKAADPPVFQPASNPYSDGIYAEGIIESAQTSGENVNLYPEVAGTVKQIYVTEGQSVKTGTPLITIDDSIQRGIAGQQASQAQAAFSLLAELKAQPRKENLDVSAAQVQAATAAYKTAFDELAKQRASYTLDPGSVSKDAIDGAINAEASAAANLDVAKRQYDLIRAGAWVYDIRSQERQYESIHQAALSSKALLGKYLLRAPQDGTVLSINTVAGAYISPQGAYDTYSQTFQPALSLGNTTQSLHVRCYVDEILLTRLPQPSVIKARMTIRGTSTEVPLTFERIQPFVSPKIELSNQRQERVDVRVLPVIFRMDRPRDVALYPGELVDVYIGH